MTERAQDAEEGFSWNMQGRVVALDNGGCLIGQKVFPSLMKLNSFAVIGFDPAAQYQNDETLQELEEFQLFSNTTLGNGQPATLYACLEAEKSATLKPKVNEWLPTTKRDGYRVLAQLPINSIALDSIEGLPNLHWLLLDDKHDNMSILEHGAKALTNALLIQVRVPFRPDYHGQADIAQVSHWMTRQGFRFYCFVKQHRHSYLPDDQELEKQQATELTSADVLFVPSDERLDAMPKEDLLKLSFVLHSVYGMHDICYSILKKISVKLAENYLLAEGYMWPVDESPEFIMTYDYSPDIWGD